MEHRIKPHYTETGKQSTLTFKYQLKVALPLKCKLNISVTALFDEV